MEGEELSIKNRLGRLEDRYGGPECPECGDDGNPDGEVRYNIIWPGPDDEPSKPEWCSTCGRQTRIVLTWDDIG